MCGYASSASEFLVADRGLKRFSRGRRSSILHFSRYPRDVNTAQLDSQSPSSISLLPTPITSPSNSSSPYRCNRGLGVLSTRNHSRILCFCPPQTYGEKCELHSDRLSVVLHLDLSLSIPVDRRILFKLLVVSLHNDEVLMIDQFQLHPFAELNSLLNNNQKKNNLISYFHYPRFSPFLEQRGERFFNRSDLYLLSVHQCNGKGMDPFVMAAALSLL